MSFCMGPVLSPFTTESHNEQMMSRYIDVSIELRAPVLLLGDALRVLS